MYFKKAKPAPADRPSAALAKAPEATPNRMAGTSSRVSTLSSDLRFEGGVTGNGDFLVDGTIKGDVRVGRLIVGETGSIEGHVSADYVEVRGRIVGPVTGKKVELASTAYVDGDLSAEQLSIESGAYFQGRVQQSRRETPEPITPTPRPTAAPAAEAKAAPTSAAPSPAAPASTPTPAAESKVQFVELKSV